MRPCALAKQLRESKPDTSSLHRNYVFEEYLFLSFFPLYFSFLFLSFFLSSSIYSPIYLSIYLSNINVRSINTLKSCIKRVKAGFIWTAVYHTTGNKLKHISFNNYPLVQGSDSTTSCKSFIHLSLSLISSCMIYYKLLNNSSSSMTTPLLPWRMIRQCVMCSL